MSNEDCTDPACFLCEQNRLARLRAGLVVLARNLRDAAGCALAAELQACASECDGGYPAGARPPWVPNLDGRAAPGWER